jgi:periplasmic protein TonB
MKNSEKDLLDLVFENKNREYGAFLLRRNYPTNMRNALFLTFGGVFLVFLMPILRPNRVEKSTKTTIIFESEFVPPIEKKELPAPPKVVTPPPASAARPQRIFVPPHVVEDILVQNEPNLMDLDKPILDDIGKTTKTGDAKSNQISNPDEMENTISCGTTLVEDKKLADDDVKNFVEKMPQFPFGEAELLKFLAKNIKTPQIAIENGIQGRVFVSFVVEKNGALTDFKIVKDPGGGCGKEVIRVLKTMPNWSPGEQNGHPVRVRMNLPVAFHLE